MKTLIATTAMIMTMTTAAMADADSRLQTCLVGSAVHATANDYGYSVEAVKDFMRNPANASITNEVLSAATDLSVSIGTSKDMGVPLSQVIGLIDLGSDYYDMLVATCVIDFYSQGA